MQTMIAFFTACGVTFLVAPLFKKMAFAVNILDLPDSERKTHQGAIPLLGGLAIYLGALAGFYFHQESFKAILPILFGGTVILYMGAFDDIKGLSARVRMYIQILVAVAVTAMGVRISFLPDTLLGNITEFVITVFWLVGVTNAFNYLDGLDGLAAGSAVLNFVFFGAILYTTGQFPVGLAAVIIGGACMGFLPHNFFERGKIFLGDAGSTFLGFMLAGIAVVGNWAADNMAKLFIPILVLGVPIFDMIFTTIMRIKEHKVKNIIEWLKYGGRDHFHHYLVDLGLHPRAAVLFIYYLTFSLGLGALNVSNDSAFEAILTLIQISIIFAVIGVLIVMGKRRRKEYN